MYSASRLLLETDETLLAGDRLFVGNQPDDFALAGVVSQPRRICLLGLGYGGSIRPLLAGAPGAHLTVVDLDDRITRSCEDLFHHYFPDVHFDVWRADARDVVREHPAEFDVICVDLYADGYPDFLFDLGFWADVRRSVRGDGHVLVNAWGLPDHLHPLRAPSPQLALAGAVRRVWDTPVYIPHRRNMTIIAPGARPLPATPRLPGDGLGLVDQAILSLLPLRRRLARTLPEMDGGPDVPPHRRAEVNEEMARRWPVLTAELAVAGERCGVPHEVATTRQLLYRPEAAIPIMEDLLVSGRPEASFVPIAAAALTFERDYGCSWFGRWVLDRHEFLSATAPEWFVNTALWQALAMAANPSSPAWPWREDIASLAFEVARDRGQAAEDGARPRAELMARAHCDGGVDPRWSARSSWVPAVNASEKSTSHT